jgi:hypothetical protein
VYANLTAGFNETISSSAASPLPDRVVVAGKRKMADDWYVEYMHISR